MLDEISTSELFDAYPALDQPDFRQELLSRGVLRKLESGKNLIGYGDTLTMNPLVISGSIKVSRVDEEGEEIFLYYLLPGQVCNMTLQCCLREGRSEVIATVEEDARIFAIPVEYMRDWMERYSTWRNFILESYELRFRELLQVIDSVAFMKLDERLLNYLKVRSEAAGSRSMRITHQEIAIDVNSTREVVSRLLKNMEKQGLLKLGRNFIELV